MRRKEIVKSTLPTRESLAEFIHKNSYPIKDTDVARAFGVSNADKKELRALIKDLKKSDETFSNTVFSSRGANFPPVSVLEIIDIDIDGELIARSKHLKSKNNLPKVYVTSKYVGTHALTIGDIILSRIKYRNHEYEAKVIKLLEANPEQICGVFKLTNNGGIIKSPNRRIHKEFYVRREDTAGAKTGEIVVAKIVKNTPSDESRIKVFNRLGQLNSPANICQIAAQQYQIPQNFSDASIKEAMNAYAPDICNREDLRDLPFVTIDGVEAKDFDDAIFAEPDTNDSQGWHIIVAIADVAYFVRPGSSIDSEAIERGNSTYLPGSVIPMLPERLSNDLCSLIEGSDRICIAVHLYISSEGVLKNYRFTRSVIRSVARLTYDQVQNAKDGDPDLVTSKLLNKVIHPIYGAYNSLLKERKRRGPLEINLPERIILINQSGQVSGISLAKCFESHQVIEEFMILANIATSKALQSFKIPSVFRSHKSPEIKKLASLKTSLGKLGHKLDFKQKIRPEIFNKLIRETRDKKEQNLIKKIILHSQSQAEYSTKNFGHYGLSLKTYTHFTSPIRRYADLIVHRMIIDKFSMEDNYNNLIKPTKLAGICKQLSETERRSQAAERDTISRYCSMFLSKNIGDDVYGTVSGIKRFGAFVELLDNGSDGFIPRNSIGSKPVRYDSRNNQLLIENNTIQLGDIVLVEILKTDVLTGGIILGLKEVNGTRWPTLV